MTETEMLREKLKRWEAIDAGKIDAVRELQAENERLKAELEEIKERLADVEATTRLLGKLDSP